jgi:tripartite-type tricarboxylate transporter receptor subunit TctC
VHLRLLLLRVTLLSLLTCGLLAHVAANAEDYPVRPVTLVVGFASGGPTDVIGRILAQELSAALGQPFIVQNKPGANSLLATQAVARAAPDGYTLLVAAHAHSVNPILLESAHYDPLKDFAPISLIAVLPLLLVTHPDAQFNSVQELLKTARAHPGEVMYASAGYGGSSHLAGALLESLSATKMTHVPYSGNGPALVEVMAGRVSFMFYPMIGVAGNVTQKRLKVLAAGSEKRHPDFPTVPTMAEAGFPGFHETAPWVGMVAPAAVPRPIIERLSAAVRAVLRKPETQQRLRELGATTLGNSPAEFAAFLQQDSKRWARVVHAAGVERQ